MSREDFFCAVKQPQSENSKLVAEIVRHQLRLERDGITLPILAEKCGMTLRALSEQLANDLPARVVRWRIERAFDYKISLWSSGHEMSARARCMREFGCDPRLISIHDLKAFCKSLGTQNAPFRTAESWFSVLMAWLASHPEKLKNS